MTPPPSRSGDRLPRSLLVLVSICILGLLAGIVLSYVYAQNVDRRLGRLEQYVQGRGEFRDQEQRRLEEQIRRSTCDLLDQLPQGGLLTKPRAKYHCGPGIPLASFPPSVRTQLQQRDSGPATAIATAPPPDRPATGQPHPTGPAPAPRTPPAAAPSATPPPTPQPSRPPITRVCAALHLC